MPHEMNGLTFGSVFLKLFGGDQRAETRRREGGDRQQQPEDLGHLLAHDRVHELGRIDRSRLVAHEPATVGAGHDQQRQAAGEDRDARHAHQAAQLDVAAIAIARGDVRTGRAGGGEEADDVGDRKQAAKCLERTAGPVVASAAPAVSISGLKFPTPANVLAARISRITSGISGKYVATLAT